MTIGDAFWVLLVFLGGFVVWRHSQVSRQAYLVAKRYTEEQGVVLLDQSIVLRRLWPRLDPSQILALERAYEFEFATLGDVRYKGSVIFLGFKLQRVILQPFKAKSDLDSI